MFPLNPIQKQISEFFGKKPEAVSGTVDNFAKVTDEQTGETFDPPEFEGAQSPESTKKPAIPFGRKRTAGHK